MTLDPATLAADLATRLRANFETSKQEAWDADRAADEFAKAIADTVHAYVSAGRVSGVTSEVRSPANMVIGTGQQTGQAGLS